MLGKEDSWGHLHGRIAMDLYGSFQAREIKKDFPIFSDVNSPVHYLDNAATSQKPKSVIDAVVAAYSRDNANVHRGVYRLSEKATHAYEGCRDKIAKFLGNVDREEIIFTRGTTDSINVITNSYGRSTIGEGDEILLTVAEHHSNLVPWQMLAQEKKARLKFIPLTQDYKLDMEQAKALTSKKTKIIACAHVSNVLGVVNPVEELIALAKKVGAVSVIDGAQAIAHLSLDLQKLDCDFYCFSSHKMLGPTGVGVLYGKKSLLNTMPPVYGGGDMIDSVGLQSSSWNTLPYKFEAGTPAVAQVLGLSAAIDYLTQIDRLSALEHEKRLGLKAFEFLNANPNIRVFADPQNSWIGTVTFHHNAIHPHDLATFQDSKDVCIRAGHHCAQPLMDELKVPASTRMSPYLYNTEDDIDAFIQGIKEAEKIFC